MGQTRTSEAFRLVLGLAISNGANNRLSPMLRAWQLTFASSSALTFAGFVKCGFTQEELAHRVGMDVSYLSELENGRKEPCLRKMKEVSQALGVPLAQLLRGI